MDQTNQTGMGHIYTVGGCAYVCSFRIGCGWVDVG